MSTRSPPSGTTRGRRGRRRAGVVLVVAAVVAVALVAGRRTPGSRRAGDGRRRVRESAPDAPAGAAPTDSVPSPERRPRTGPRRRRPTPRRAWRRCALDGGAVGNGDRPPGSHDRGDPGLGNRPRQHRRPGAPGHRAPHERHGPTRSRSTAWRSTSYYGRDLTPASPLDDPSQPPFARHARPRGQSADGVYVFTVPAATGPRSPSRSATRPAPRSWCSPGRSADPAPPAPRGRAGPRAPAVRSPARSARVASERLSRSRDGDAAFGHTGDICTSRPLSRPRHEPPVRVMSADMLVTLSIRRRPSGRRSLRCAHTGETDDDCSAGCCVTTVRGRIGELLLLAGACSALLAPGVARADSAPLDAVDPPTPATVTADGLPTVQINGVVWSQVVVGNTVYVAGKLHHRPAGRARPRARTRRPRAQPAGLRHPHRCADHVLRAEPQRAGAGRHRLARRLADLRRRRLHHGNGQARNRIAAFDTATGALVAAFAPERQRPGARHRGDRLHRLRRRQLQRRSARVSRTELAAVSAADGACCPGRRVPGVGPDAISNCRPEQDARRQNAADRLARSWRWSSPAAARRSSSPAASTR